MRVQRCGVTGKVKYRSLEEACYASRIVARHLNARRELAASMYGYQCGWCRKIHVTRDAAHEGVTNELVFAAPPEKLQRWAFPPASSVPH